MIKYNASYNNHIHELMDELADLQPECAIYSRLLAMETDMREWLQQQMTAGVRHPFITDEMLSVCADANVIAAFELKNEVSDLLNYLGDYWQTTDEFRSELN